MSTQQVRDIDQYFPTEPWLERYRDAIEASEEYAEKGGGWGVDWAGAFIFHIQAIPLAERTIADLPEEIVAALDAEIESRSAEEVETIIDAAPDEVQADVRARDGDIHEQALAELHETNLAEGPERIWPELREEIPGVLRGLLTQLEESVVDGDTVYAYLDVYDGGCREVDVIQDPDERDHGFRIIGEYESWRELVNGDGDIVSMLMAGEFDVDGDMQKILQYTDGAVALTDLAAELETRFII
jgi:putative sterol carrier protein